jgi:hypothetical protein
MRQRAIPILAPALRRSHVAARQYLGNGAS